MKGFVSCVTCGELLNIKSKKVSLLESPKTLTLITIIICIMTLILLCGITLGIFACMSELNAYQKFLSILFTIVLITATYSFLIGKLCEVCRNMPIKYVYFKSNILQGSLNRLKVKTTLNRAYKQSFTKPALKGVVRKVWLDKKFNDLAKIKAQNPSKEESKHEEAEEFQEEADEEAHIVEDEKAENLATSVMKPRDGKFPKDRMSLLKFNKHKHLTKLPKLYMYFSSRPENFWWNQKKIKCKERIKQIYTNEDLGQEESILSYKGMEEFASSNKVLTFSNTSRFIRKGTTNSKNTGSNSIASVGNRINQMKEERKMALKKKSTLLFIQENQDNPNTPQSRNNRLNNPENAGGLLRRKTMLDQYRTTSLFQKSNSFKPEAKHRRGSDQVAVPSLKKAASFREKQASTIMVGTLLDGKPANSNVLQPPGVAMMQNKQGDHASEEERFQSEDFETVKESQFEESKVKQQSKKSCATSRQSSRYSLLFHGEEKYKFSVLPVYNPRDSDKEEVVNEKSKFSKVSLDDSSLESHDFDHESEEDEADDADVLSNLHPGLKTSSRGSGTNRRDTLNIPSSEFPLDEIKNIKVGRTNFMSATGARMTLNPMSKNTTMFDKKKFRLKQLTIYEGILEKNVLEETNSLSFLEKNKEEIRKKFSDPSRQTIVLSKNSSIISEDDEFDDSEDMPSPILSNAKLEIRPKPGDSLESPFE